MKMPIAPRIAVYGRHSTALQNPTSSEDQIASCMKRVELLGGTVVATCSDPEESGYKRDRPGLKQLLAIVEMGDADIIVCEALDRLARDAEDIAFLGKKLSYHGVRLHTLSEGDVDEIKFAVASLLGAIFLKNLVDKTLRGMEAAVLAGRFAGGRAYAYNTRKFLDANGEIVRGYLDIDPAKAKIVNRIYEDFASGMSSIQIATALNQEGIPSPRGGEWNASTIRGDPKKGTGILNNPLYTGRLVWGRRQWRRNPDSEQRERRYRMRDRSEWIEVEVPDLRIIDDELWAAVADEIERRAISPKVVVSVKNGSPVGKPRKKHLLSGQIRCSVCGANYTISGKDYYRCAGQKERGTCSNKLSVKKEQIETATLAVLQHHLFTDEHAKIFVDTFNREILKLSGDKVDNDKALKDRLSVLTNEIKNLSANLLSGVISPTLAKMLGDRESEYAEIVARLAQSPTPPATAKVLPHPELVQLFRQKITVLANTLNDDAVQAQAAALMDKLIESVTIYPDGPRGPEAEVVANVADLVSWATNDNTAPKGGVASSTSVVAGAGFEPATFRL